MLTLCYDGTDFHGWQRQPGRRTVQQRLEEAIERLTGVRSTVTASGRTDAGVHALGQVVHFFTTSRHSPEVFLKALNALLPAEVRVLGAEEVPQAFHATLDAKSKRYRYEIDNAPIASPFLSRYSWHVFHKLSMSPPKSSPRSKLSFFGAVPPLQAYLPRLDPTSGFPGSPSAVRRGTRRSSSLASSLTLVFSCALPVSSVAFELSGWWLRQVCDLIGSVQPSIRFDPLI
jgi:hypothetical protein